MLLPEAQATALTLVVLVALVFLCLRDLAPQARLELPRVAPQFGPQRTSGGNKATKFPSPLEVSNATNRLIRS
jgi:hypothetical protein